MENKLSKIGSLLGIQVEKESSIQKCQIDSRQLGPGDLFFAIKGQTVDGHQFLEVVAKKGAVGAVVSKSYQGEAFGLQLFRVEDVEKTLHQLAKEFFRKRSEKVVAITGSMGKTTTKEFLACLLSARYRVGKTPGNHNTQLTVPLTLLNLEDELDILVLEMGMSRQKEIAKLVQLAPPDLAIITRIAPAGIEGFVGGFEAVAKAKAEIFSHPATKWGVISAQAADFSEVLYAGGVPKRIYGWKKHLSDPRVADFVMEEKNHGLIIHEPDGSKSPPIGLSFEATHIQENFLAAASAARMLGVSWEEIRQKAKELKPFPKRFEKIERDGITFIQDCYNANPDSVLAALENLPKPAEGGKVVGVLGSMPDLGQYASHYHHRVGEWARGRLDCLLSIGEEAKGIQTTFSTKGKKGEHFSSLSSVQEALDRLLKPGDVVLIKGGNGLKLWELLEK